MKEIDYKNWKRRQVYEFFSDAEDPFYMVSFRQDVTELYNWKKRTGSSFYYAMIWAVTKAVNSVEEFMVSIEDGKPFLNDERIPSFTDMRPGEDQFYYVYQPFEENTKAFCDKVRKKSREQDFFIDKEMENGCLIYISCLPWIDLTALKNERINGKQKQKDFSVPLISWGKYTEDNGRKTLCISVEVNHRLIDGYHIGRFAEELTKNIKSLELKDRG